MTYIPRTVEASIGGPTAQYDFSKPTCGPCLERVPGWRLMGSQRDHAHQPRPWCAGTLTWWGFPADTVCVGCGASLAEYDRASWGVADPGKVERLRGLGTLLES